MSVIKKDIEIKKNKNIKAKLSKFYRKNYKKFMIIPLLLFLISVFAIYTTIQHQGTPIYRDISLKGGVSAILTINVLIPPQKVQKAFATKFPKNSFSVSALSSGGKNTGYIIDTDLKETIFKNYAQKYFKVKLAYGKNYNSNYISPTLSNTFFIQALYIIAISFILMAFVIFFYFREFVPAFAVVLSGAFDIFVTVGILDLMKFKISIPGIGALIMLIGYSIDTDVLLTNRLLREKEGNIFEKTFGAFKTGILMSLTTLFTGIGALIFTNSSVIYEIALILVIGLCIDIISTWLQNAPILLNWLERKENKN